MRPSFTFRHRGQTWILFKRNPASSVTPWTFGPRIEGKKRIFATGTADRELAVAKAKRWLDEVFESVSTAVSGPSRRSRVPTIGEVVERYLKQPGVRPATAKRNAVCLLRIVRAVLGTANPGAASLEVVTRELGERWLAMQQSVPAVDYGKLTTRNYSANSVLRQAKSIFGVRRGDLWKGVRIPEGVAGFLKVRLLKEPGCRYVPIPSENLEAMDEAAKELMGRDMHLWVCHKMVRLMGLRDGEVLAATTGWLVRQGEGMVLQIVARPDVYIPKGREGSVTVPSLLVPWFDYLLVKAAEDGRPVYLVADTDREVPTRRLSLVYRSHPQWLRKFLPPDRKKPAHELRKEAGSLVAKKFNSWEAAARFLREDLNTAKNHYLEVLSPVGLEESELSR